MRTIFPSVAAPVIHRLAEKFLAGHALPPIVVTEAGEKMSLTDWLATLRHDQTPFDLANRLGLMAFPPQVGEAARRLRNRLVESTG